MAIYETTGKQIALSDSGFDAGAPVVMIELPEVPAAFAAPPTELAPGPTEPEIEQTPPPKEETNPPEEVADVALPRLYRTLLTCARQASTGQDPIGLHADTAHIVGASGVLAAGAHWRSLVPTHKVGPAKASAA